MNLFSFRPGSCASNLPRLAQPLVLLLLVLAAPAILCQTSGSNLTDHSTNDSVLQSYVQIASELTSRARANVYFSNPQSIFAGVQVNFVNVGTGNLTFLRRDMVTSGRIPLVLARIYDSGNPGGTDFGPGWSLSCAETISVQEHLARLSGETGAVIEFMEAADERFVLRQDRPSDYVELVRLNSTTLRATLRTGFTKEFSLIGNLYRLTKVTHRNGSQIQLIYEKELLSKLQDGTHFIELGRNPHGRVIRAQDDQGRHVQFLYNAKEELVEADDLGGAPWKYRYFDDHRLLMASDPMGRMNFAALYDELGRVRRLRLPSGTVQYDYDPDTRSTTVVDRRQHLSRFFQNNEGITVRIVNALGEETAIGLDANRNVSSLSRNGTLIQKLEYDPAHHLLKRQGLGSSASTEARYSYDPATGLLAGIESSNTASQSFSYDAQHNLLLASLADGLHKYTYSPVGDLTSFAAGKKHFEFSPNPDGLIASFTDSDNGQTYFDYKAGGELSKAQFAGGQTAKYEYLPSGLRSRLTYQDKRRVEYAYDPAGNLLSTNIFDSKGKQVEGQTLTLNDAYQVIKRGLFDGTLEAFDYDPNGNLTRHIKNRAVTKFEYDELDRLVAVVTPAGERLAYSYSPGEHSIVEQYEHSSVPVVDLRDTGFTFAAAMQVMAIRPVTSLLGPVRFSENLVAFQLANAAGTEIVTPESGIEQSLHKLNLLADSTPLDRRQNAFNRPFNTLFMPAEYASINCCFSCSVTSSCRTSTFTGDTDTSSCCPPCDPPSPPSVPTPRISDINPKSGLLGQSGISMTITGAFNNTPITVTAGAGITVRDTSENADGTVVTAKFDISTAAATGSHDVRVNDSGGSSNAFAFVVNPRTANPTVHFGPGSKTPGDNLSFLAGGSPGCSEKLGPFSCATDKVWIWNVEIQADVNDDASNWTVAQSATGRAKGFTKDSTGVLQAFDVSANMPDDNPNALFVQQPQGQQMIFWLDSVGHDFTLNGLTIDSMTEIQNFTSTVCSKVVTTSCFSVTWFVKLVVGVGGQLDATNSIANIGNMSLIF